jgi:Chromo (CHRromatin Organisation MOdifier) domain
VRADAVRIHMTKTDTRSFIVEKILRHGFTEVSFRLLRANREVDGRQGDVVIYEVKWKGYPSSENTWEPEENLECVNRPHHSHA